MCWRIGQLSAAKKIDASWSMLVDATLLADAKQACSQTHLEPTCGFGAPGPFGNETGCPQNQRAGCTSNGPQHTFWCHPPAAGGDGIDPITKKAQVLDDEPGHSGALCREHCENWATYNIINDGSNPPRLSDCHVSWHCQAWTFYPSRGGDTGTCFWYMFTHEQIGADSWRERLSDCDDCTSGFNNNTAPPAVV